VREKCLTEREREEREYQETDLLSQCVNFSIGCLLNSSAFSASVDANPPWRLIIGTSRALYFGEFLVAAQRLPLLGD